MGNNVRRQFTLEDARILKRYFAGDKYGKRSFLLALPEDLGKELLDEGWNVRHLPPRDEEEEGLYCMNVQVRFDTIPPNIYIVHASKRRKTRIDEDTVASLDWAEISSVDLTVSSSRYDVMGKQGIKAYLKAMYVTVVEDELASKYDFEDEIDEETPFD